VVIWTKRQTGKIWEKYKDHLPQELTLFCPLFNLSIATNKREIAAGVTPGILLAWPRFADKQITRKEAGELFYPIDKSSFKALSSEARSSGESIPSFFRTSFRSMVEMAGFIVEGLRRPASFQFLIRHSPISKDFSVWLVTAMIISPAKLHYSGRN
jgi:hypothetical protein